MLRKISQMTFLQVKSIAPVGWNNKTMRCFLSTQQPEQVRDMVHSLGQQVWEETLHKLEGLGFTRNEITQMLLKNPLVSKYSEEKLRHHLEVLRSLGFKTEEIKELVKFSPQIFDQQPRKLKNNHSNILVQLGDHQGRVAVMNAPNVLIDNPLATNQKISYCLLEMYLTKPVISSSKVLRCPFSLIQTRHKFAYRAGLYKKIDAKNKEGIAENPRISTLFFSSNEAFLERFKGFTIEDYIVFESLVSLEDQPEEDDEGEEEDDEESNSNVGKNSYRRNK